MVNSATVLLGYQWLNRFGGLLGKKNCFFFHAVRLAGQSKIFNKYRKIQFSSELRIIYCPQMNDLHDLQMYHKNEKKTFRVLKIAKKSKPWN